MPISAEIMETRRSILVSAARALIREKADAGFSMNELAKKAGVSYATPYNLVSTKANLLALVVEEEFLLFRAKMEKVGDVDPLTRLLSAIDRLAEHYADDQPFYFGLFRAAGSAGESSIGAVMQSEGRALFLGLVRGAIAQRPATDAMSAERITDVLLRVMRGTVEAWYVERWTFDRFRNELGFSARLILLPALSGNTAARVRAEITRLQT